MVATAAIVLAAGQGTRMRSRLAKVLHPLAGRPMIEHVLAALSGAGVEHRVVVTGHGADAVEAAVTGSAVTVRQDPQLGTADAVRIGLARVPADVRHVVVTMGDTPLLPADVFQALLREQAEGDVPLALLAVHVADPGAYGRVVRGPDGSVTAIVEAADADAATRAIDEVNVGSYCFDAAWLRANIGNVGASPSGEYYLTDLVELAVGAGRGVAAVVAADAGMALGINDRVALAEAERLLRASILERHMLAGVTIVDPSSTWIDAAVEIGQDARIEPGTVLEGETRIGQDAVIGPSAHLRDSGIGPRTRVWMSVVEEASVAEDSEIGPYTHLRPGAEIGARCRIGNFAEVKKSRIGAGTQQHHFSYIGDAEVGEDVNIGAGAVTANYDGEKKNRTVIGRGASIGVDTMLRAPLTIGEGARTGAGSVVTRDVAPGVTVVGMPARPMDMRRRRGAAPAGDAAGSDPVPAGSDRSSQQGGSTSTPDA